MKKLLGLSTAAIIMSTAGVVSAASNPFSDVPADSWAYDAVATLSADGVIDGYPDGTYKGGNTMTRFEMAQIVARAMAKTDIDKADKALVDKLAAEFAEELDNLGVRVADLEKKSDNVQFSGTARLRYDDGGINATNTKANNDDTASHSHIEYWIKGKVNDDWTAIGQIETEFNNETGSITAYGGNDHQVNKVYVEGPLFGGTLKAGRYGEFSSYGRIIDTEISGAEWTWGDPNEGLSGALTYGRLKHERNMAGTTFNYGEKKNSEGEYEPNDMGIALGRGDDAGAYTSVRLKYNFSPVTAMGVTYGHLDHITMENNMYNKYSDDGADMWEIGFNTSVADNLTLMAAYSKSDRDGVYDSVGDEIKTDGWFSELRYKKHDIKDPGSFAIFANYRNVGALSTIDATVDYTENIKGWTIGFDYVPIENTTIEVFYINGSQVNATTSDGAQDADIFRAQMEFYF
ncbi:S-layer homology domain-containing protein [Megamonas hypermegale]|uniref:S-layer homology domain-containing protein n=1 Tax=Megamonas hypermegale TaxID=158847 RepID=UPI0026F1A886|nr:S-layer homology domain-containing protein [Megamonas hypermegale]